MVYHLMEPFPLVTMLFKAVIKKERVLTSTHTDGANVRGTSPRQSSELGSSQSLGKTREGKRPRQSCLLSSTMSSHMKHCQTLLNVGVLWPGLFLGLAPPQHMPVQGHCREYKMRSSRQSKQHARLAKYACFQQTAQSRSSIFYMLSKMLQLCCLYAL